MGKAAWIFEVEHPDGALLYGVKVADCLKAEDYLRTKLKLAPDHWVSPLREATEGDLPFRPGFTIVGPI